MLPLNLPEFDVKVAVRNGKPAIFDRLRRKYVVITPEEWVRQHFVNFLLSEKQYPENLIANEIGIDRRQTRDNNLLVPQKWYWLPLNHSFQKRQ